MLDSGDLKAKTTEKSGERMLFSEIGQEPTLTLTSEIGTPCLNWEGWYL